MRILVFLMLLLGLKTASAQVDTVWVRNYNGPANSTDKPCALVVDDTGNVYVAGYAKGIGTAPRDYVTIKYNSFGDSIWVNLYDGPWGGDDYPVGLLLDDANNVYVAGASRGIDATFDYATIKYDDKGDTLWVRHLNGPWADNDYPAAFTIDDSSNVYITGITSLPWTKEDYMTVKYNSLGDTSWVRLYDHAGESDSATAIATDQAGNIYVTGMSWDYTTRFDYATVKYDASGTELWVSRFNGLADSTDIAVAITADSGGDIYVTGASWTAGSGYDIVTVKYNSTGDTIWTRLYNGSSNGDDIPVAIALDYSGNIYVTGYSTEASIDYCTIRYDPDGNEIWVANYDGKGGGEDRVYALATDDSCNSYITGASYGSGTWYDYATVKYDSSGNEIWVVCYEGVSNDIAHAIAVDGNGYVYVTGEGRVSGGANIDFVTIKYTQKIGITEEQSWHTDFLVRVEPNPFRSKTTIRYALTSRGDVTIAIYNLLGQEIKTLVDEHKSAGFHQVTWDGKDNEGRQHPPGIYFLQVKTQTETRTEKLVVLR